MTDASDAIPKAVALNKKLAASLLVRKEELEEKISRAEGGAVETLTSELAGVQQQLASALAEIAELRRLANDGRATNAQIASLMDSDPLVPTPEERALQLAREGIAETEAMAELSHDGANAAETTPMKKPSQADADEQARKEFDALREASTKPMKKTM